MPAFRGDFARRRLVEIAARHTGGKESGQKKGAAEHRLQNRPLKVVTGAIRSDRRWRSGSAPSGRNRSHPAAVSSPAAPTPSETLARKYSRRTSATRAVEQRGEQDSSPFSPFRALEPKYTSPATPSAPTPAPSHVGSRLELGADPRTCGGTGAGGAASIGAGATSGGSSTRRCTSFSPAEKLNRRSSDW